MADDTLKTIMPAWLDKLYRTDGLAAGLAELIYRNDSTEYAETAALTGALLVRKLAEEKEICICPEDLADRLPEILKKMEICADSVPASMETGKAWISALEKSSAVSVKKKAGKEPQELRPLFMEEFSAGKKNFHRIYLQKYRSFEKTAADRILELAGSSAVTGSGEKSSAADLLFTKDSAEQKAAALKAMSGRFTVISGGPGTGKTTVVAKLLLMKLLKQPDMTFALAAPTGKAAARMNEALLKSISTMEKDFSEEKYPEFRPCFERMKEVSGVTIHRLLKAMGTSGKFRMNADSRLPQDLVIIDEASMVDVSLMSKLLSAVKEEGSVILLGDSDQLSSVEPGSVLADVCSRDADSHVKDRIGFLTRSWRFDPQKGIGRLSRAIRQENDEEILAALNDGKEVQFIETDSPEEELKKLIPENLEPFINAEDPGKALDAMNRFRILSPMREGRFGVNALNLLTEQILAEHGLIKKTGEMYENRQIIITVNSPSVNLFNGDTGVVRKNPETPRAYFTGQDGSLRELSPVMLPEHETVFAMTVHKSQGSEFNTVVLVLPDGDDMPLMTKELLYTGITRAKEKAVILGKKETVLSMCRRHTERSGGLRDRLSGMA